MNLTIRTTGREFQELYLGAIENNTLEELKINLENLINKFPNHYLAHMYLARVNNFLGNKGNAEASYKRAIKLFNPILGEMWISGFRSEIKNFSKKYDSENLLIEFENAITGLGSSFDKITKKTSIKTIDKFNEAKKAFTKGNFNHAMKLLKECEENPSVHKPALYINMLNTSLALHNPLDAKKYLIKGLDCENSTKVEKYSLYHFLSTLQRKEEKWGELIETYKNLLKVSESQKHQIISMQGLIQTYLKNEDIENAKKWIDELLSVDPNNKIARRLLNRLSDLGIVPEIDEDDLIKIGEEFAVEIESSLEFELSPMLEVEIENHKFSDPEILKKGGKPLLQDAERILMKADELLNIAINEKRETYVYYPRYLEAAKAFSKIPSDIEDDTTGSKLQRCLSRYSSLRAGAFFSEFNKRVLEKDRNIAARNKIRELKDSADSYYIESLRLELDKNSKIAEEIVDNYIKLNAIYSWFQLNKPIETKNFDESFKNTAYKCLRIKESKKSICNALLNIGAANPENFNKIFSGGKDNALLEGQPRAFIWFNRTIIINEFMEITHFKDTKTPKGINKLLKELFESRRLETYHTNLKFNEIKIIDFNSTTIQLLSEEWKQLKEMQDVLCETDIKIYNQFYEIISGFKPYLQRSENERRGIIDYINEQINLIQQELREHPTYWGRIGFEPILENWKNSIRRLIQRRSKAIQPRISAKIDPPKIVISESNENGSINIIVQNVGTATASSIKLTLGLYNLNNSKLIFETQPYEEDNELSAGDKRALTITLSDKELVDLIKISTFKTLVVTEIEFKGEKLFFEDEETIDIHKSIKINIEDIPWHETLPVKPNMFKGRDELIDSLENHYLGRNRIETYNLYGLTRHGKSSIHKYLTKRLFLKEVNTEKGSKRFIPFLWSFATAANNANAKDMWSYFIKNTILEELTKLMSLDNQLENLKSNDELRKFMNRGTYRNIHFKKILQILNKEGYLPFIAIDEFTFYTTLIDNKFITPSFLQQIREITIDEQLACFIFAGVYDLNDILKDPKYGITSQLANTIDYQIGPIDDKSANELINVIEDKLKFTNEALTYLREVTNNIPYFIQIICRRSGYFAVASGRSIIGKAEIEKIISVLTGETDELIAGDLKRLKTEFNNTQYRSGEKYHNAIISTIAHHSEGKSNPVNIYHNDIILKWGAHGSTINHKGSKLGSFQGKLTEAIEDLKNRGVISEDRSEGVPMYRLAVDLFRRWWLVQYPDLDIELDKLIEL